MSYINPIGKLFQTYDATVVDWKIANFSTLPDKVDTYYISPFFTFLDACWYLMFFPNGQNKNQSEGHMGLYVAMSGKCDYSIDVTLCIKDATATDIYRWNCKYDFKNGGGCGCSKFYKRSELMSRGSALLPADVLNVQCTMKNLDQRPVRVSLFQRLLMVSRKMKAILKGEKRTDVVLKLNGQNFKAHRAILETGSPVFAAMFGHDMVESRTGEVAIDDVDADIFQEILSYVYSGQVEDLSANNVYRLYVAADKYDLVGLKELCTTFMEENISVDLFCEVVTLADTYNETDLMKFAKDFFTKNSMDILESVTWKKFLAESCAIAAQLLESVVKDNALNL